MPQVIKFGNSFSCSFVPLSHINIIFYYGTLSSVAMIICYILLHSTEKLDTYISRNTGQHIYCNISYSAISFNRLALFNKS